MKNKIAFVAVGQAGGNIGQLFEDKGFTVLYVNTSQEDLDTLEKAKFKYHIPNGEGCNKDRRKAKQLVIDDFDNIVAEIESKIKADMIFVIFASGGGTGSAPCRTAPAGRPTDPGYPQAPAGNRGPLTGGFSAAAPGCTAPAPAHRSGSSGRAPGP